MTLEYFMEYMEGNPNSDKFKIVNNLDKYDPDYLLDELNKLIDVYDPNTLDQIHITNVPGHEDDIGYSYGSLHIDLSKSGEEIQPDGSRKYVRHFYDKPIPEESFTSISNIFKNTVFETITNELRTSYRLGRFRVMISKRSSCLSWHMDEQPRLHYPLKTQRGCFMIVEDEPRHLKKGVTYLVDTVKWHTAVNASREIRIHLVANIL